MNRIDRLSAILIQLQTRRYVTARSISERFGISIRTVYRDISALQEAGVPIGGEPGRGYFIVEGYHLPPVMFTRKEAAAMLTAEKLVEQLTDQSTAEHYTSAMYKVKSVLHETEKDFLETIDTRVQVMYFKPECSDDFPNNFISDIQQAIAQTKILSIAYYTASRNETIENRQVEPIGICFYGFTWHLIAYCRLRKEMRDFRVDRIKKLTITEKSFDQKNNFSVEAFFESYKKHENIEIVNIRCTLKAYYAIGSSKYYFGLIKEQLQSDIAELSFASNDPAYIGRWLMGGGGGLLTVSSTNVRKFIKEKAQELVNSAI